MIPKCYPTEHNDDIYWNPKDKTMHYVYGDDECIIRHYDVEEMVNMMVKAGFDQINCYSEGFKMMSSGERTIYEGVKNE